MLFASPAPVETLPAASSLLAGLTAGLAAGDDLRELMARFLEPITQIAGAQAGAVRVADAAGNLRLVGDRGLPPRVRDAERTVGSDCGVCGAALAGDRPVWTDDLAACRRRHDEGYFGRGAQRVLAVPMQHRGQVLGVLSLFFERNREPSAETVALLKSIGDLLGLALQHARLEEEHLRATARAERHAMAADVHDSIGQSLAFVKMRLPLLQDAIGSGDRAATARYFDDVRSAVGQAHASLRGILAQARLPAPSALGLAEALRASVDTFRRHAGVSLDYRNEVGGLHLGAEREAQVFHVVQEALTNIARHAGAQHAWLHLSEQPRGTVRVVVEDDGGGFDGSADEQSGTGTHYGLTIMHERARRLGGTLCTGAREGGGARVQLDVPIGEAAPEDVR